MVAVGGEAVGAERAGGGGAAEAEEVALVLAQVRVGAAGDEEARAQQRLQPWRAQVLLRPHHGSLALHAHHHLHNRISKTHAENPISPLVSKTQNATPTLAS